jgi:hypothetical protein
MALEGGWQSVQSGKWFHYLPSLFITPALGFEIVLEETKRFPLFIDCPTSSLGQLE